MADSDSDDDNNAIPSVFIDSSIVSPSSTLNINKDKKAYLVDNEVFFADETMDDNKFVEFELYASKVDGDNFFKVNGNIDTYCSTPEDSADEDADTEEHLEITIQKVPYGIIINSNVYLTNHQWHTIMSDDMNMMHCFACNMYSDIGMSTGHMECEEHLCKLARYKPLARFDLSIIRKIRNQYHCGVCNEVYNINDNHEESHFHEHNLLFAINKVSDIMYDLEIHRNDNNDKGNRNNESYHFNANNILNRNFDDSRVNESVEDENDFNEYYNDYENENNDFVDPNSSTSYANTLKNAKAIDLPKYLEKDLGTRKVKVKFDSWHMIICPKINVFYCMVCKVYLKSKGKHCNEKTHLESLDNCKIIDTYEDYFIRQVNDKFYHCGHCNNLQWMHLLDSHIESKHRKPKRTVSESSSLSNNDNDSCKNKEITTKTKVNSNDKLINKSENNIDKSNNNVSKNTVNVSKNTVNDNLVTNNNLLINNNIMSQVPLENNMILNMFGLKISVSLLSYNVICRRPTDFYCGLCNVIFREDMIVPHIYALPHIQCLQRTPFIVPFNCNLVRAIREALHCAICNTPVSAGLIYIHIQDPIHISLLNKALKINATGFPFSNQPQINNNNVLNPITENSKENNNDRKTEIMKVRSPENQNAKKNKSESPKTGLMINDTSKTEIMKVKTPEKQKTKKNKTDSPKTELMTNDTSETELMIDDSFESVYDFDSYIYVKFKNTYFRISISSYNTLVHIGDGSRYCFVCSSKVNGWELSKHIENRSHMENLELCKFLDKPDHLLRQMHLTYHCSSCNVLVSRKHLTLHSAWPTHIQEFKNTYTLKRTRKLDFQNGVPNVKLNLQKEELYLNDKEPEVKVIFKVKIGVTTIKKEMKIIIVDGDVLKLAWDNWNGICSVKNGLKCIICCMDISDIGHALNDTHEKNLQKEIKREYLPNLFREVNSTVLHCIICNSEVANTDNMITQHIEGKKHKKAVESLHTFSSLTEQYEDCNEEVLQL